MLKMKNTLINKLIQKIYFCCGLIIIIFIFYNLIFKYFFYNVFNYIYVILMLVISLIIQISYLGRFIKFLNIENIYQRINNIIDIIYWKPLNTIYDFVKNIKGSGDFLYRISKLFVSFCIFLDNKAIPILCFSCYLIPKLLLLFMLTFTIFFYKINTIYFFVIMSFIFIFVRFISLFSFILNDFAVQNKKALKSFLIITTKRKNRIQYELNMLNVKNPSKEKLTLYAERYSVFNSTEIFISSFKYYKTYKIDSKILPYTFSLFFICLLKLLTVFFHIYVANYYFFIIFVSSVILEKSNMKKQKT